MYKPPLPSYLIHSCDEISKKIRKVLTILLVSSFFLQCMILSTPSNIISSLIALLASLLTNYLIYRGRIILVSPFSFFTVCSYNIEVISFPLIFQSFTWLPYTNNLLHPVRTLFLCTIYQLLLIITLYIYTFSSFRNVSQRIAFFLKKLKLFEPPDYVQTYIISLLSLLLVYRYFASPIGNVAAKFFEGIAKTYYILVYLIPIFDKIYPQLSATHKIYRGIAIRMLPLCIVPTFLIAIALNYRSFMFFGLLDLSYILFLLFISGYIDVTFRQALIALSTIIVLGLLILPPLNDLFTATTIARKYRGKISYQEMLHRTFAIYHNKELLRSFRLEEKKGEKEALYKQGYFEQYTRYRFLDRLCALQMFDRTLSYNCVWEHKSADWVRRYTMLKVLALLPAPVLKIFHIDFDKAQFLSTALGGLMFYIESGYERKEYLGGPGFINCSFLAHGIMMFGLIFFLLIIPLFLLLFIFVDSLVLLSEDGVYYSICGLLAFTDLYRITIDAVNGIFSIIFRGYEQIIVLYVLLYFITYYIAKIIRWVVFIF